jgi:glucokinase
MAERHLLADVGGTNTRVALADGAGVSPGTVRAYRNAAFPGLAPLLAAYLDTLRPGPVTRLCAAVAGPVAGEVAQLTNHDWFIDGACLRTATGADATHLINDLQAQGHALDDLPAEAVTPLFPGRPAPPDAPRLVINLGTGCNAAVVHRVGDRLFVPAAESGHSALPHATGRAAALLDHLRTRHPHLPVEAALSGPGLSTIHEWVTGTRRPPAEVVADHAGGAAAAHDTLALFAGLLGTVAGGLALHHLPLGGIFLTGGTARAVAPHLPALGFHAAFVARGPYTEIVRGIPVSVVTADDFALAGCARYLTQCLK